MQAAFYTIIFLHKYASYIIYAYIIKKCVSYIIRIIYTYHMISIWQIILYQCHIISISYSRIDSSISPSWILLSQRFAIEEYIGRTPWIYQSMHNNHQYVIDDNWHRNIIYIYIYTHSYICTRISNPIAIRSEPRIPEQRHRFYKFAHQHQKWRLRF